MRERARVRNWSLNTSPDQMSIYRMVAKRLDDAQVKAKKANIGLKNVRKANKKP